VIVRFASLVLAGAFVAGCAGQPAPSGSASEPPRNPARYIEGKSYQPAFEPGDFVQGIDNPYLPLRPGTTLIYQGVSDGERERVKVTTTSEPKEILGITATVVRDQVFVDGELAEDTFDWYAQDRAGNVWYLGETGPRWNRSFWRISSTPGTSGWCSSAWSREARRSSDWSRSGRPSGRHQGPPRLPTRSPVTFETPSC
jgi:hypothetical protein